MSSGRRYRLPTIYAHTRADFGPTVKWALTDLFPRLSKVTYLHDHLAKVVATPTIVHLLRTLPTIIISSKLFHGVVYQPLRSLL